jgi:hypothetical protein
VAANMVRIDVTAPPAPMSFPPDSPPARLMPTDPQLIFELLHGLAHCRRGDPELACGATEAAQARHGEKDPKLWERSRLHCVEPPAIIKNSLTAYGDFAV